MAGIVVVMGTVGIISSLFDRDSGETLWGVALVPIYVVLVWSALAVNGKRCHDLDSSAWLVLVALIPILGLIVTIQLWFVPGTDGPNRYGPDPRQRA
jgi:uncharacterized membrane protein YhaH (DUF805 family)